MLTITSYRRSHFLAALTSRTLILCALILSVATSTIPGYAQEGGNKAFLASSPAVNKLPEASRPEESIEKPYGLKALWRQSDLVARSVLLILAFMSVGT